MKELTHVNPYIWESERAKGRKNKGLYRGRTIMDRTIDKFNKLNKVWKKEAAHREAEFRRACGLPDRDVSLEPFTEQPFGTLYVPRNGGMCGISEEVASHLSSSVAALALFDGDVMLFACTGIALPERTPNLQRFLTSAHLAEVFNERRNNEDNLNVVAIKVRLPNKGSYNAFLELYDQDIAIVTSTILWGVSPVDLDPHSHERGFQNTFLPAPTNIVAAGRSFVLCGLMATTGTLNGELESMISGCCITEAALGGPLVDLAGNFLGMNISCGSGNTCFMPRLAIVQRLYQFRLLENNPQNEQVGDYARKECMDDPNPHGEGSSTGETKTSSWVYSMPPGAKRIKPSGFLRMLNNLTPVGYPDSPPLMLELDGQLLHKFEEDFGYLYTLSGHSYSRDSSCVGMNPWARLDAKTTTTISRRVVSLSSYKGSIRFFSCTGLLIKCPADTDAGSQRRTVILTSASLVRTCDEPDTIDKNLRIEVFLPPKQHAIGTLESYDSHHNIAIVSFKGLRAIRPEDIFDHKEMLPLHVVAIGREPEAGLLCASTGKLTNKPITALPCKHLELSTCKIKKAGIGVPLINFDDGIFIGMNFYDGKTKGTPFLPRSKILEVLSGLELMSGRGVQRGGDNPATVLDCGAKTNTTKRWPVPQAYWHNELLKKDWDGDGFAWTRQFMDVNTGR